MGDNILNLASVPCFVEANWIGLGKQYPTTNTPYEVHWAKQELLQIPVTQEAHFPPSSVSVTQFLHITLSPQSAEIINTWPQTWFSSDLPCTNTTVLMSRPVPPKSFLDKLEKKFVQAWFDGAKSVVDPRFNNSTEHLPLWVITFWKRMAGVIKIQETWQKIFPWLDKEERQTQDTQMLQTIWQARDTFTHLGWNSTL